MKSKGSPTIRHCEPNGMRRGNLLFGSLELRALNDRGLTLIELVIAVGILLVLLLGITTYLRRMKTFISDIHLEGDLYHEVAASLHIMDRDFKLAYKGKTLEASDEETTRFFSSGEDSTWPTFFVGNASQVDFTSSSHLRLVENALESQVCRIFYKLEPEGEGRFKLQRHKRKYLQENSKEKESFETLLSGISHFSFQYFNFRASHDPWVDTWDSESSMQGNDFPSAIKISFDIEREKKKLHVENVWRLMATQSIESVSTVKPSEDEDEEEGEEEPEDKTQQTEEEEPEN
ncbi:MAG: prepilin-type N-terminal cleavage/methylation domain-containing protein [Deltaproteobacteria bacterium]|nr:prepilin-type N-terminal cleavage/methylation domain-containing protein [Deltaproteobacteria bacterium]